MAKSAAKIVTDAILGKDMRVVRVAGKSYVIEPPTIYRLAGAANALDPVAEAKTPMELIASQSNLKALACALSWFIVGGEELTNELMNGTLAQVSDALNVAYGLLSVRDFSMPLLLARNVAKVTANQKQ